jgi:MmyB-like transcription regulator ligand binding domain
MKAASPERDAFRNTAAECLEFARATEELLERRRRDHRGDLKDWSRDELCDLAYSSYKALLRGVVRRPPKRVVVAEIADHLECTLQERDRLLIAAGYAPEEPYLTDRALEAALETARDTLERLPWPSMALTRDMQIRAVNDHMLRLFGAPRALLEGVPATELNMLNLVFNPDWPLYARLGGGSDAWLRVARRDVLGFKRQNALATREPWYRELIERLLRLPRFEEVWTSTPPDAPRSGEGPDELHLLEFVNLTDAPVRVRTVFLTLGDLADPRLMTFLPQDAMARRAFADLGVPVV